MELPALRAELTTIAGTHIATAEGIGVSGDSSVLGLCRALIEAGHDPATPLNVYRGDTLSLRVRSIGEGAALEIAGDGIGFRRTKRKASYKPGAAPPTRL